MRSQLRDALESKPREHLGRPARSTATRRAICGGLPCAARRAPLSSAAPSTGAARRGLDGQSRG